MDVRTRMESLAEAIETVVEAKLAETHTAVPFRIVSVDNEKHTAVVQPLIKSVVRKPDGTVEWLTPPEVHDVPLHFPHGGGVTMTMPVKKGDTGLLMVSSRSQDSWQQNGDEQPQIDLRQHDLSNSFAIVGFKADPSVKKVKGYSSDTFQIRDDDSKTVIDFSPGKSITVTREDGSFKIDDSGITMSKAGVSMKMTSDGIDFEGGYIKHNGKSIDDGHIHGGIVRGGDLTDPPAN